jgi:5'-methylthioadenosine phosphorylase
MVTDYDCWREGHDDVTIDQIVAVLHQNADNASKVVRAAVAGILSQERTCGCRDALKYAILTDRNAIPAEARQKLSILLDKYL